MGLGTVELVVGWETAFGISIPNAEAEKMITTRQATEFIFEKVRSSLPEDSGCLSMRAFFRLRQALQTEGVPRNAIQLETKMTTLLPRRRQRDILRAVCERAGLRPVKQLPLGLQSTFGRVKDVVLDGVVGQPGILRREGYGWSLCQVREVVRAVMYAQQALSEFSDDAEFVKDLKLD